jgi:hypothetical protein
VVVTLIVEADGELESEGESGSREGVGLPVRLWERERLAILEGCAWGVWGLGLGYWVWWIVTDRTGAGPDAGQGAVVGLGSGGGLEGRGGE